MSLDKAIEHGKEKRKPWMDSRAIAKSCRNHGDCEFCKGNRLYGRRRLEEKAKLELKEY